MFYFVFLKAQFYPAFLECIFFVLILAIKEEKNVKTKVNLIFKMDSFNFTSSHSAVIICLFLFLTQFFFVIFRSVFLSLFPLTKPTREPIKLSRHKYLFWFFQVIVLVCLYLFIFWNKVFHLDFFVKIHFNFLIKKHIYTQGNFPEILHLIFVELTFFHLCLCRDSSPTPHEF